MSDKFTIVKNGDRDGPWFLEYPAGFDDYEDGAGCIGVLCETFAEAIAQFGVDELRWCIMGCQKGAVEDRDWGWECTACGSSDVAVGCERPKCTCAMTESSMWSCTVHGANGAEV